MKKKPRFSENNGKSVEKYVHFPVSGSWNGTNVGTLHRTLKMSENKEGCYGHNSLARRLSNPIHHSLHSPKFMVHAPVRDAMGSSEVLNTRVVCANLGHAPTVGMY